MYYSGYDHLSGCDSLFVNDTTYKDVECVVMMTIKYWWLLVGFVGGVMHTYILFCYILSRDSHRDTIDTLIMTLSCFDLISCIGLMINVVINTLPNYYDGVDCFCSSILLPFYRLADFIHHINVK